MSYSVGTDVVAISRIEELYKKSGALLLKKYFSAAEIAAAKKLKGKKLTCFLAKRFAGKEAVAKALGTGLGAKIAFKQISIGNEKSGKPVIQIDKKILLAINKKFQNVQFEVSLSDDEKADVALAFVVLKY